MGKRGQEFQRARMAARRILHEAGVTRAEHIDVEAMVVALGVEIVRGPLGGASAHVQRIGGIARMRVSDRITDLAEHRWSIAHELGHLALGHELLKSRASADALEVVARACRRTPRNGIDPEHEADAFAAELLMPEALARDRCEVSPVSLEPVWALAEEFRTSLPASAIRFAELTSERCAAVFSVGGSVCWAAPSPTFTADIRRGARLARASIAFDYFDKGRLDDRPQEVAADAWLDHGDDAELVEHSTVLAELDAVMSMLWVPETMAPRLGMSE